MFLRFRNVLKCVGRIGDGDKAAEGRGKARSSPDMSLQLLTYLMSGWQAGSEQVPEACGFFFSHFVIPEEDSELVLDHSIEWP